MNTDMITRETALNAALESVKVKPVSLYSASAALEDGYWVLRFETDELRYECYVDAMTGEVPGLLTEPVSAEEVLKHLNDKKNALPDGSAFFLSSGSE